MTVEPTEAPWWIALVLIAIPLAISTLFGALAFRRVERQLYRCTRCAREFTRAAHRRYPRRCPRCGARDWSATSSPGSPR